MGVSFLIFMFMSLWLRSRCLRYEVRSERKSHGGHERGPYLAFLRSGFGRSCDLPVGHLVVLSKTVAKCRQMEVGFRSFRFGVRLES